MIIYFSENPEVIILEQQRKLLAVTCTQSAFAVRFNFLQYYLTEPVSIELLLLVCLSKKSLGIETSLAIFPFHESLKTSVESLSDDLSALQNFAHDHQIPWLNLSDPFELAPVKIPKPWGQEIWYTGIEVRGLSAVTAQGFTTPLPWVLAVMPSYLTAGLEKKIILLKMLDPLPDEVYGDLYFELHEKKQEVYIVTHVNEAAWKNKIGAIRLGFNSKMREQYSNDEQFKRDYLTAVKTYEVIRRTIDNLLDVARVNDGIELNSPTDAATIQRWSMQIPTLLIQQEKEARIYMNSFSGLLSLQVGDVVKIPCFVPHALQHGVRTLEFQTPVYERKILSFAQKVLTQTRWDTEEALAVAQCDTPVQAANKVLFVSEQSTIKVEEIVSFDDFRVLRVSLAAYTTYSLPAQNSYALMMPINTSCNLVLATKETYVAAETALFIPHAVMSNKQESLWISSEETALQVLIATTLIGAASEGNG